jgi:prepilin signal peptidase PulO-like enzyme (type II secretory pathway)
VHNGVAIALGEKGQFTTIYGHPIPASIVGLVAYAFVIYTIGLLSYVVIVSFVDKRKKPLVATWEYIADNCADWREIALYYAGKVIPPLAKYSQPAEPLEGFTAEDIEADEDAGGMGGGDGKLAAGIGANLYLMLSMQSFLVAIFSGAFIGAVVMLRDRRRLGERTAIPFGPHMAIGALASLLFGANIYALWLSYLRIARPAAVPGSTNVSPGTSTSGGQ